MKGLAVQLSVTLGLLLLAGVAEAEPFADEREVHYFYLPDCPYCAEQENVLAELQQDFPELEIIFYQLDTSRAALTQLQQRYELDIPVIGAPLTVFNGELFLGYSAHTAERMRELVSGHAAEIQSPVMGSAGENRPPPRIDTAGYSLPVAAVILGSLDGVNVCSISALAMLLALVIGMKHRSHILLYGSLFIAMTAITYGVLVFAWYSLMNTLVFYRWLLEVIIAAAGLGGGAFFFIRFRRYRRSGPTCSFRTSRLVAHLRVRLGGICTHPGIGLAAGAAAVLLFATAITVIELPCSVGLPMVFAGMLADNGLHWGSSVLLILLYLLSYMAIEIGVLTVAVVTRRIWTGPAQAVELLTLAAALVLLTIGSYYAALLFIRV